MQIGKRAAWRLCLRNPPRKRHRQLPEPRLVEWNDRFLPLAPECARRPQRHSMRGPSAIFCRPWRSRPILGGLRTISKTRVLPVTCRSSHRQRVTHCPSSLHPREPPLKPRGRGPLNSPSPSRESQANRQTAPGGAGRERRGVAPEATATRPCLVFRLFLRIPADPGDVEPPDAQRRRPRIPVEPEAAGQVPDRFI